MRCPTLAELPPPPNGCSGWPWTEECQGEPGTGRDDLNWPRISIVTPSYNQGHYLEETIRSVLLQGYPRLEYVVIDGGSTDDSVEIIRRYEGHLAWWVSEEDKGPSHALNKGFARATGEIYAYLNSDDLYEPDALRVIAAAFRAGNSWVVGQVRYFQAGLGYWPVPHLRGTKFTDWFVTCPISQPGCFWSAQLHRNAGCFREDLSYFFDYELWLRFRFVQKTAPLVLHEPVAIYRLHPQSKTVRDNTSFAAEGKAIREHYRRLLSPQRRAWLWIVRRHRKAKILRSRSLTLLRQGRLLAAARQLVSAYLVWPLITVDRETLLAIRRLVGKSRDEQTMPAVFPEWDD